MNAPMVLVGLAKALFGIIVGALGIFVASRVLHKLLKIESIDKETGRGNNAYGILMAGSLVALGLLLQHAVSATFVAMDLMYRDRTLDVDALKRFLVYAASHLTLSVIVSSLVLALGTWLFTKLTRGVDELAEIRNNNNTAAAIVLAAVMVVLALMTAPGLQMALDGMLPLPTLGRDEAIGPS